VFFFFFYCFWFSFSPWFAFRPCQIFSSRCIFASDLYWFSSKEVSLKKFQMVLEKRKSFVQNSGTRRSLCRLRLRLFHVMLDVLSDSMLSGFAVAWLVSNNWDCLMSLWKNHALLLIVWKHYFGFLLYALFGLTWRMLTHVRLIQSLQ
jgi:hypothetical protein